jgi:hypothetical protein
MMIGEVTPTTNTNFSSGTSAVTNVANMASSFVPIKGDAEFQSKFSKFNEKQAQILGTAALIVQVVPVAGQVVGLILGAVAALSTLVARIFFTSKAKQYAAERGQYEVAIGQLRDENLQLDVQINTLKSYYNKLREVLGVTGNSLNGLGICLINCNKNEEERLLNQSKATFEQLKLQQKQKIDLVYSLFNEVAALMEIKTSKNTAIYLGLGAFAFGVLFYLIKKRKKK